MPSNMQVNIKVFYADGLLQTVSELLGKLNELSDLVPDWNNLEKQSICDEISLLLGTMLETKRTSHD